MASNKSIPQALQNELFNARLAAIEQALFGHIPGFTIDFGVTTVDELDPSLSAADKKIVTDELTAIKTKSKVK